MNDSTRLKRCLVTGASGFIGSALCRTLKERGSFVKALFRNQNSTKEKFKNGNQNPCFWDEISYFDLEQKFSFDSEGKSNNRQNNVENPINNINNLQNIIKNKDNIDTIFHLAGIAHSKNKNISKEKYWQVNVNAAVALLKLAHQSGVKQFIYFSSVKAADVKEKEIEKGKATEEHDFYAASKHAAEQELLSQGLQLGIHVSIIRPALVYGKGVKGNLANMISGIKKGWFPNLPQTKNQRSLVSIEDLIDAAMLVASTEKSNGKIYTITDGQPYSTHDLLAAIRKALGKSPMSFTIPLWVLNSAARLGDAFGCVLKKEFPLNSDVLEKLLGSAHYSNQDIHTDLNWSPKFTFYDKVSEIVAESQNHS